MVSLLHVHYNPVHPLPHTSYLIPHTSYLIPHTSYPLDAGQILESFKAFSHQRDSEFFLEVPTPVSLCVRVCDPLLQCHCVCVCVTPSPPAQTTAFNSCVGLQESCIQLAACGPKEVLPMHPSLPADLFTACLTTPIKTALLWYCYSRVGKLCLVSGITPEIIDK